MSEIEAEERGLRLVPVWWPVLTAMMAALFSAGATYGTVNARFNAIETHQVQADTEVAAIKADRKEALRDWTLWRADTDRREQRHDDAIEHMSKTVDRIADKLGVVR